MRAIFNWLQALFAHNNQSWIAQILTGAGLGIITIVGFTQFIDYYKDRAIAQFGQLGPVSGLLGLSGVDKAISIVIGAYCAAVYIKTFAKGLKVAQK